MVPRIDPETGKQLRGFARMSPELRREIAAKGGRSTPPEKRAYAQDRELAARAGALGGAGRRRKKKA